MRRSDVRFLDRHADGQVLYAPLAQTRADVTAGGRKFENASVSGTAATLFDIRDLGIASGRFFGKDEEDRAAQVAVIGMDVAEALFPGLDPIGRVVRIGGRGFTVIGMQARQGSSGGVSLDRFVWMPLQAFERVFGAPASLQVFARAPTVGLTRTAEDRARATMRARRQLRPGRARHVRHPHARGRAQLRAAAVGADRRRRPRPISIMALLAAIVVVTNTTLVSVTQRTREIGVRRALGAARRHIIVEVLAESSLIAVAGGAVGLAGAQALLALASGPLDLDLPVRASTMAWSLGAAAASGIVAGWYPARRAARIDPSSPSDRSEPDVKTTRAPRHWSAALRESASLAVDSVRTQPARSVLAIAGIVIGIVTVVLVASVLANLRNQVALLFRELGTDNVFAFHLTGDPYQPPSEAGGAAQAARGRVRRRHRARRAGRSATSAIQVIVPTIVGGRALTARAGARESDTVLVEGASPNFFDVVGAEFAAGRPFTELEDRRGAQVAVIGASLARALFGSQRAVGKSLTLSGDTYFVVGEMAPRKGGFFGENRQDSVLSIPVGTAKRRFAEAENVVLYARAKPGLRDQAKLEVEAILRRLRRLTPAEDERLQPVDGRSDHPDVRRRQRAGRPRDGALAAVSLFIGGIGIANVQIISARERTREIGVRLAIGAPRRDVLAQFLLEAVILSTAGGLAGVLIALAIGLHRRPVPQRLLRRASPVGRRLAACWPPSASASSPATGPRARRPRSTRSRRSGTSRPQGPEQASRAHGFGCRLQAVGHESAKTLHLNVMYASIRHNFGMMKP